MPAHVEGLRRRGLQGAHGGLSVLPLGWGSAALTRSIGVLGGPWQLPDGGGVSPVCFLVGVEQFRTLLCPCVVCVCEEHTCVACCVSPPPPPSHLSLKQA